LRGPLAESSRGGATPDAARLLQTPVGKIVGKERPLARFQNSKESRKERTMTRLSFAIFVTVTAVSGAAAANVYDLAGQIAGGDYRVTIAAERAQGTGPQGPIDVQLTRLPAGYDVRGLWNGDPVHFVMAGHSVRGQATRHTADSIATVSCRYEISRASDRAPLSGLSFCQGRAPAHLELQPRLSDLSRPQNVILLLAYLTAPAR
jgi:hypothetical protein